MADGSVRRAPSSGREFTFTAGDFARVRGLIRARAGIALADSKEEMVYSRLARRLRALGLDRFDTYLDALEAGKDREEWQAFTNALTTNLTSFFREGHHFDMLRDFLAQRPPDARVRIWCAAASTGEEPYSLAISACEAYGSERPPVAILATDIDTQVLATAERGVYPLERVQGLPGEQRRRYFLKGVGANAGHCRVIEPLRALLTFRPLNLLDPSYALRGPFDAIFCRNVMIYFDKPTQLAVLRRIAPLLAPHGLFFAGHSESFFHADELLRPIGRTVYRRAGTAP